MFLLICFAKSPIGTIRNTAIRHFLTEHRGALMKTCHKPILHKLAVMALPAMLVLLLAGALAPAAQAKDVVLEDIYLRCMKNCNSRYAEDLRRLCMDECVVMKNYIRSNLNYFKEVPESKCDDLYQGVSRFCQKSRQMRRTVCEYYLQQVTNMCYKTK